jgi:hypothetical protein
MGTVAGGRVRGADGKNAPWYNCRVTRPAIVRWSGSMSKVILSDDQKAQLDGMSAQVCDRAGRTVGYLLTPEEYKQLMYAWAKSKFTEEEAERAWTDYLRNGGVSTQEAWRRVKAKSGAQEGAA